MKDNIKENCCCIDLIWAYYGLFMEQFFDGFRLEISSIFYFTRTTLFLIFRNGRY